MTKPQILFIVFALVPAVSAFAGEIDSTSASGTSSARYELYTGVGAAKNSNTVQSLSGVELSSPQAKRFDVGLNYNFNPVWNVGAVASFQTQARSKFNEAFLNAGVVTGDDMTLQLRLGARNYFVGSNLSGVNISTSDMAFVGTIVPQLHYVLPAGFSVISSSLSGRSPFDGIVTVSARSSAYIFYGESIGIAKSFGPSVLQVRSGYHRLTGGGDAYVTFIPIAFEGKIQLNKQFALGASYELPGNRETPNFSAATEYELFESNAMIWATTAL